MNKSELLAVAKPILFNTPMAQAILDGRKTATRRIVKPQTEPFQIYDILYVRETWCKGHINNSQEQYFYRADENLDFPCKWRPSIHMPKEAARIFLRVTDVRVERLQDITEEQAKAEGAIDNRGFIHSYDNEYEIIQSAREYVQEIWNSTIKKADLDRYGWNANLWVWVIEFERLEIE